MVKVGIAGIGFMGVTHYKAYASVAQAEVARPAVPDQVVGGVAALQAAVRAGVATELSSVITIIIPEEVLPVLTLTTALPSRISAPQNGQ